MNNEVMKLKRSRSFGRVNGWVDLAWILAISVISIDLSWSLAKLIILTSLAKVLVKLVVLTNLSLGWPSILPLLIFDPI